MAELQSYRMSIVSTEAKIHNLRSKNYRRAIIIDLTSMFKVIQKKKLPHQRTTSMETIISGDVIALVALHYNPNLDSEDLVKNFQEYILVSEERMQSFLNLIHEQHPDLVSELYARGDTDNESFIVHSIFKENSTLTSMAQLVERKGGLKKSSMLIPTEK